MAYQTVLVPLPMEEGSDALLGVATTLAEQHQAHLIGLHVVPMLNLPYQEISASVSLEFQNARKALAEAMQGRFAKHTEAGGFVSEWREVVSHEPSNERQLIEQANTSDLIVMGQPADPARRGSRGSTSAHLLAACGRPVLLVAPDHGAPAVGDRVFIAWDGQRASTRALFAALPLLCRADAVRLQRINAPSRDRRGVAGTAEMLAETLSLHGVNADVQHADVRNADVGTELLAYASDWEADVIVAGCFEQGGLRETLFGSTTRHLLCNASVPLLMSA